ncbi:hypothetical protein [Clostridium baratii]|uniref:hypothetical protein n=1 Tax=Clostridium baratii TaxID=1561 RepID=UPI00294216BE|nr:hypothetical protein [Clostridium baratii]
MENNKLPYEIKEKYSYELNEINNILNQLQSGRVYDLTNVQGDGFISTHIVKLKKELNSLLNKIQNGKDSVDAIFAKHIIDEEK